MLALLTAAFACQIGVAADAGDRYAPEVNDPFRASPAVDAPQENRAQFLSPAEPPQLQATPPSAGSGTETADRATSDRAILSARHLLAVGDVRRAREQLDTARRMSVAYEFHEDSPARVEADLTKYEQIMASRGGNEQSESWRREYALALLQQADALLRWSDLDGAERLSSDAARLDVQFGPFEASPQTMLARIAAARRTARRASPPNVALAGGNAGSAAPSGGSDEGPAIVPPAAPAGAKSQVATIVRAARAALASGDTARAERLVQQATTLGVPDDAFADHEDSPRDIALDIQRVRAAEPQIERAVVPPPTTSPYALPSVYDPNQDTTYNRPATAARFLQGKTPDSPIDVTPATGPISLPATEQFVPPAAEAIARPVTEALPPATVETVLPPATEAVPARPTEIVPPPTATAPPATLPETTPPPAAAAQPLPPAATDAAASSGETLFRQGEQALLDRNKDEALRMFRAAYAKRDDLDPITQQRLQDHLQMLARPAAPLPVGAAGLIDSAADRQQVLTRQLSIEVARQQSEARRLREKEPRQALEMLQTTRGKVAEAGLEPAARTQLLRRVDLSIAETERYIEANRAQIELDEENQVVKGEVERRRTARVERDQKLADLVEQFNQLRDEERYAEMEVIAKRARELAPDEPVVVMMWEQARFIRRKMNQQDLGERKGAATAATLDAVRNSGVPFSDDRPFVYGDAREWERLTKIRGEARRDGRTRHSEREMEIERKLKTPVSLSFQQRPLAEVMDHLARLTGVNIHLDPRGLSEEGIRSDEPVTIELNSEISLKSALNLVLEPLHLSYVIKDEVLKITSEQMRDGEVYTSTYNVADLVIPIPNFQPGAQMGLQGMLQQAQQSMGYGPSGFGGQMAVVADQSGAGGSAMINPQLLAQMPGGGNSPGGIPGAYSAGPGGLGGGAAADFDALIELIQATIQPNTWDEVGGPGSVREFATNLSLVVSQTQDVHEEIVDLLDQLRRLQDLQVTIEVRFIRLNDSFFERIGIDFDFNINDNTDLTQLELQTSDNVSPSATVGLQLPTDANPFPAFTADLDIPFRQDSFTLAAPAFGSPADVASFGFAILSDIEAFFLINASQGDRRSNILQAPKVTLFNGQQAFVSDTSQTPFVISVIPVVGDFAAAQQPVIVVLSEGTFLTIQAVVSNDRRYVRLTVVPFFSQIGDVQEFQFEGSQTSTNGSSSGVDQDDDSVVSNQNNNTQTRQGTTVQLPTFAFVTVTTTVSVPDGGTVLLGGIKRLSEGRNEFGVPLLSKLPYVNRLFRNVGIGRDAESLMMMVTPRIIIQEEEEERLGISSP